MHGRCFSSPASFFVSTTYGSIAKCRQRASADGDCIHKAERTKAAVPVWNTVIQVYEMYAFMYSVGKLFSYMFARMHLTNAY